jgi:hypothetical protein
MREEIKELEQEVEDLTIHLSEMLETALFFAGVDESKLELAVKEYINAIDDVFEEDGEMGYKEIVATIEYLKNNKKELFA